MRLTDILLRTRPHGYLYRGKYRIVKKVTLLDLLRLRFDYERQERNMLLLRHPYLTSSQSYGHMSDIRPKINVMDFYYAYRNNKYNKQITIAERLNHVKTKENWD
ncbi:uncharacterized protein LOC105703897 [Orussus abietinus]|uniref:uncharacterized protein LOC105703897 n=1 Tax=Orussus abietinus TaxID=222816 RepID=UPI000626B854|nr:uncharacterized protein LOC105703897 [Orussus abietinus]